MHRLQALAAWPSLLQRHDIVGWGAISMIGRPQPPAISQLPPPAALTSPPPATPFCPSCRHAQPPQPPLLLPALQLFIGGQWVDAASGKTFPVEDPRTGEEVCRVAEADAADVDAAVAAARAAFDEGAWPRMSGKQRGRVLSKLADLIEANLEELAALESLDNGAGGAARRRPPLLLACSAPPPTTLTPALRPPLSSPSPRIPCCPAPPCPAGKPLAVAKAADIPLVADHFRYFAGWADKIQGKTIPCDNSEPAWARLGPPEPA